MRAILMLFVVLAAWSRPAWADDKPVIGPVPEWVKPTAIPAARETNDDAPVKILLMDQQMLFERGKVSVYGDLALRIQSGQGLAAGSVSLPWRPELDVLTVHKLLIHRGDEVIDVLASGQTFTVMRREANLEVAMLDGMLTANIQPEGLRVGDTMQLAYTLAVSDPTLQGHVEQLAGMWNGMPVVRANFRAQWPSDMKVRLRAAEAPELKRSNQDGVTVVELTADDIEPIPPPEGAPLRFSLLRLIELSDFSSWSEVSALMAPLYEKAARIPREGPLRMELDRIRGASADPRTRAEAALALVQERVRYVALLMGVGGLVPADAETTWSRRFGDCKGKTALLLALLDELDIEAEPVLVSTRSGDGMNERLPMVGMFDHVIVRARIGDTTYWLDGTRSGDTDIDRLAVPAYHWGLPVLASKGSLVRMMPPPLSDPDDATRIRIDASEGILVPAPTTVEAIFRRDLALSWNKQLKALTTEQRDRYLREHWRDQFDFVEVKSVDSRFDTMTGEMHLTMEGLASMEWDSGWYETDQTGVGYRADFSRLPGPFRDAPFRVNYPFSSRMTETILLPPGFENMKPSDEVNVDTTVAGIEYKRKVSFDGKTFTVERSARSVAPEFPFEEAAAAEKQLRNLADNTVYIRKPRNYARTKREREALLASTPTNAEDLADRGWLLHEAGRFQEAIVEFNKALELEPTNNTAVGRRAYSYWADGDAERALADTATAIEVAPTWAEIYMLRLNILRALGRNDEVIKVAEDLATANPKSSYALTGAANTYSRLGKIPESLKMYDQALALEPSAFVYINRAFQGPKSRGTAARIADLEQALKLEPESEAALAGLGSLHSEMGNYQAAAEAFSRLLEFKPKDPIHLLARAAAYTRLGKTELAANDIASARPTSDEPEHLNAICWVKAIGGVALESALDDCEAALAKHPESAVFLDSRALALLKLGRVDEAIATYDKALAKSPRQAASLYGRAIAWSRKGDMEKAHADADAAMKANPDIGSEFKSYGLEL